MPKYRSKTVAVLVAAASGALITAGSAQGTSAGHVTTPVANRIVALPVWIEQSLSAVGSQVPHVLRSFDAKKQVARRVVVPASTRAIAFARKQLGKPYVWGAEGPNAFDCSGLTRQAYRAAGVSLPRTSRAQVRSGRRIAASAGIGALRPGDLVFWAYDPADLSTVHHVAIYLGGGKVIQSPESGDVVKISPMWMTGYAGAVRVG